jgi:hypothetical protein
MTQSNKAFLNVQTKERLAINLATTLTELFGGSAVGNQFGRTSGWINSIIIVD